MKKLFVLAILLLIMPLISFGQVAIEKNLKLGDKDNQVVELKNFLIQEGIYKRFLGIELRKKHFGKKTQRALKEWQKLKSLPETGELDDTTKVSVNKILIGNDNIEEIKKEAEPVVSKKIPKAPFGEISKEKKIEGGDFFCFENPRKGVFGY